MVVIWSARQGWNREVVICGFHCDILGSCICFCISKHFCATLLVAVCFVSCDNSVTTSCYHSVTIGGKRLTTVGYEPRLPPGYHWLLLWLPPLITTGFQTARLPVRKIGWQAGMQTGSQSARQEGRQAGWQAGRLPGTRVGSNRQTNERTTAKCRNGHHSYYSTKNMCLPWA